MGNGNAVSLVGEPVQAGDGPQEVRSLSADQEPDRCMGSGLALNPGLARQTVNCSKPARNALSSANRSRLRNTISNCLVRYDALRSYHGIWPKAEAPESYR